MLITKLNAEWFQEVEESTVKIIKAINKGKIERLVDNYARLLGEANARKAAYMVKQAKAFKEFGLRNVVFRGLVHCYASYKTDPINGEKLFQVCESVFDQARAEANEQPTQKTFWDLQEEYNVQMASLVTAVAKGDKQRARELKQELKQIDNRMTETLKQAPMKPARKTRASKK